MSAWRISHHAAWWLALSVRRLRAASQRTSGCSAISTAGWPGPWSCQPGLTLSTPASACFQVSGATWPLARDPGAAAEGPGPPRPCAVDALIGRDRRPALRRLPPQDASPVTLAAARAEFDADVTYLDTVTFGLPPRRSWAAIQRALA